MRTSHTSPREASVVFEMVSSRERDCGQPYRSLGGANLTTAALARPQKDSRVRGVAPPRVGAPTKWGFRS